jgi:hypothetical protein
MLIEDDPVDGGWAAGGVEELADGKPPVAAAII